MKLSTDWNTWNTPWEVLDKDGKHGSHGFANFQVAAGTIQGKHHGPPFHDGDMYKWLEACAAVYAITKDGELDELMDRFIEQVTLAQRADGYIHTPVVIAERLAGIDSHSVTENAAGIEIGKDQIGFFTEYERKEDVLSDGIKTDFRNIPKNLQQALSNLEEQQDANAISA